VPIGWADAEGRSLLVACGIGCIAKVDTESGAVSSVRDTDPSVTRTPGDQNGVTSAVITPDHARVVEVLSDGSFRLYSGAEFTPASSWVPAHVGSLSNWGVFTDDGALLVTGGHDGSVRFWRAQDGAEVGTRIQIALRSGDVVRPMTMSGGRVLTVDWGGTVRSVPTTAPGWKRLACRIAGRDLTTTEWDRYLPGRAYEHTCI
jgi:WD40 repeat protein